MFGKEATETMWITEVEPNQYYLTRAESHGSVYITRLSVEEENSATRLTMSFTGKAQNLFVKIISIIMLPFLKKSMINMLQNDLQDIKAHLESA